MRVARPTDNLEPIARMYAEGLEMTVLAEFRDHDGFDGAVLGNPGQPYHIEFTTHRRHTVGTSPTKDHLLVFYVPDRDAWSARCERMLAAGFRAVASYNTYWDVQGRTFEDPDGYRVVVQNTAWTRQRVPEPRSRRDPPRTVSRTRW